MNFFNQTLIGITTYFDAHRLIFKHRLWGYLIAPGIINAIVFCTLTILVFRYANDITQLIINWLAAGTSLAEFLVENRGVISFLLSLIIKIIFFIGYLSVYKYIVLLLMSPVLALMSERVETILSGNDTPFNFADFINDMLRGMLLALRNLFLEILLLAAVFLLSFIPLAGFITPFVSFYISSYYYGFSMLDYSNERRRLPIRVSILAVRSKNGVAFGNGALFYLLLMLPFIGWIVAPAYSVTAAAIANRKVADKFGQQ